MFNVFRNLVEFDQQLMAMLSEAVHVTLYPITVPVCNNAHEERRLCREEDLRSKSTVTLGKN